MALQDSATSQRVASATACDTVYSRRARFFSSDNNFEFAWPAVPARQFLVERDRVFNPDCATGLIPLDCSDALETRYPATTPSLLLCYAKLRAGESLATTFNASGEIHYVMQGQGAR